MSDYVPDKWVIVETVTSEGTTRKVLASWYGSYLGADEWRLSSGITYTEDVEGAYIFHNESGSTYECILGRQGMSTYTTGKYNSWLKVLPKGATMRIVEEYNEER